MALPDAMRLRTHRTRAAQGLARRVFCRVGLAVLIWAVPNGPSAGWYDVGYDLCMSLIAEDRDWECELILPALGE